MNCEPKRRNDNDSSDSDYEHEKRKKSKKTRSKINSAKQKNKLFIDKSSDFFTSTPVEIDSDDEKNCFFKKNPCGYSFA